MRKLMLLALISGAVSGHTQSLGRVLYGTFPRPTNVTSVPGDPTRVYVTEKVSGTTGTIRLVKNGVTQATPFLAITPVSTGSEQGLLGIAFHPDYISNGLFYVNFTNSAGSTVIARYRSNFNSATNNYLSDAANTSTRLDLITISQPFSNHNGGTIQFGDDGYLYIGMGDGGSGGDPGNRSQNITTNLLGKVLRIDVNRDDFPADTTKNYGIPAGNPFITGPGLDEIWNYGLRNPWKISVDSARRGGFGGIMIPDVGQSNWEEVNYEPPQTPGRNYGWREYEGNAVFSPGSGTGPFTFPGHVYDHTDGCSVSGGVLYRGARLGPEYWGKYFFSDFCDGWLDTIAMNFDLETGTATMSAPVRQSSFPVNGTVYSIDQDADGELYIGYSTPTQVHRIVTTVAHPAISGTITLKNVVQANQPKGVWMRYINPSSGAVVKELQVGLPTDGKFRIPAYLQNYNLQVQVGTWISKSLPADTTSGADLSGLVFELENGDCNGDNEIGPADFTILSGAFGTSQGDTGYVRAADLNRDGEVGPADFTILSGNFGLIGD